MYTQSEAEKCGISKIPFFVMLLMFIVVHFMMFSAKAGSSQFNISAKKIKYASERNVHNIRGLISASVSGSTSKMGGAGK